MKKSYWIIAGLLILLIMLPMSVTCTEEPLMKAEETRPLMGTYVTVIVCTDEAIAAEAIDAAFARMEEIEKIAHNVVSMPEKELFEVKET